MILNNLSLFFLMSFALLGCFQIKKEARLMSPHMFLSVDSLLILDDRVLSSSLISTPPAVFIPLLELHLKDEIVYSYRCLVYKSPFVTDQKVETGSLYLFNKQKSGECSEFDMNAQPVLSDLHALKVSIRYKALSLQIKTQNEIEEELIFPLYNLENREKERLSAYFLQFNSKEAIMALDLEHRRPRSGSRLCKTFQDNCKTTEDHCNECANGAIPVVSSRICGDQYEMVCAPDVGCGTENEVACFRGYAFSLVSMKEQACFEGSYSGYCLQGLHTICDDRGVLICK